MPDYTGQGSFGIKEEQAYHETHHYVTNPDRSGGQYMVTNCHEYPEDFAPYSTSLSTRLISLLDFAPHDPPL